MSLTQVFAEAGLKPVKHDRDGPAYALDDVNKFVISKINNENYFYQKGVKMMSDTKKASEKVEMTIKEFGTVIERFIALENSIVEQSKKTSGSLKDASEKLAQGISRVEKAANFERLERYVSLLERAATAMKMLAEIEATGKLEKIAGALK